MDRNPARPTGATSKDPFTMDALGELSLEELEQRSNDSFHRVEQAGTRKGMFSMVPERIIEERTVECGNDFLLMIFFSI
jgi:hypothetical protein